MGLLSVTHVIVQVIICIKLITSQSQTSVTFRSVKKDATIVGIEPFYNQTTFSLTECYLACHQQIERCFYVEVANVNGAWSCKLFNIIRDIKKHMKFSQGSEIAEPQQIPKDCVELKRRGFKEGVYFINGEGGLKREVYCDMTTDGGGWIVIQKRFDGSVDFNRSWADYKNGFGDVNGEYWLGNEFVHQYTKANPTEMKLIGIAFDGVNASAKMQNFQLSDEASKYIFDYDTCQGLCGSWLYHKGLPFLTPDQDNHYGCAKWLSGWWFENCFRNNFNGKYSQVSSVAYARGIHWGEFRGFYESLKETIMLIRQWNRMASDVGTI